MLQLHAVQYLHTFKDKLLHKRDPLQKMKLLLENAQDIKIL